MKFSVSTVSYKGYHKIKNTENRLNLIEKVAKKVLRYDDKIKLICFPGGFLYATSEGKQIEEIANRVSRISQNNKIAIICGIDTKPTSKVNNPKIDILIKKEKLYSFAIYTFHNNIEYWRQRSSTSKNQKLISDDLCNENRTINIGNKSIEILLCGEIFNQRIRESIIDRNVNAVIDIAHEGDGFRIDGAMKIFAQNNIPCFCSVHVEKINAIKKAYFPENNENGWRKESTCIPDIIVEKAENSPRIEIKVWRI
jgi:hypothetical protein